jgi:hypothetical protein
MSVEYLRAGFEQIELKAPDALLEEVYRRFDGIIGWLTYIGFRASLDGKLDRRTIEEAAGKASEMVGEEFRNFLTLYKSKRYSVLMRALARRGLTWAELKRTLEAEEGMTIGQGEITKLLSNLQDAGFVGKDVDGVYFIADPMLAEAAARGVI